MADSIPFTGWLAHLSTFGFLNAITTTAAPSVAIFDGWDSWRLYQGISHIPATDFYVHPSHSQLRALCYNSSDAQATPSLLRRGVPPLNYHQLLSASRPARH
ncbi:MAG: hypothetical protein ACRD2S_06535, partial [Terriglobales bacterium]